ncbi:hypothetical protein PG993_010201 [Apiospora rasikravindrae]|uniref:2EXR domain-containing protein n=1 Tax=Apiospora rasikravindrae TaxID=990691 RepID=A0ABR1SLJ3_9PEZI
MYDPQTPWQAEPEYKYKTNFMRLPTNRRKERKNGEMAPANPAGLAKTKFFNDERLAPTKTSHTSEFHFFSYLPLELRLRIWTLSLTQHRFIPVCIRLGSGSDGPHPIQQALYSDRNQLGNIVSGTHYELSVNPSVSSTASPLFSATAESRLAALEFFRIRLPLSRGHIRICPEYDVLYLQSWQLVPSLIADVLHDIRAYDPKDEGLMHLALDHSQRKTFFDVPFPTDLQSGQDVLEEFGFDSFLDVDDNAVATSGGKSVLHHPVATASFVDILSTKLRSLWCVEQLRANSRVCYVWPPQLGRMAHVAETCPLLPHLDKLGRSCVDFDWLEHDPRPVQPDLEQLPFDKDPRRFYYNWRCLEDSLGVIRRQTASHPFHFYVCVANQVPRFEQIDEEGKAMARSPLTKSAVRQQVHRERWSEAIEWEATSRPDVRCLGHGQAVPDPGSLLEEGRRKQRERGATTALGMWIFPAEAFGQVKKTISASLFDI